MDDSGSAREGDSVTESTDRLTGGALSRSDGRWTRVVQWMLLDGDRMVVAGALLAVVLVAYMTLEVAGFTAVQNLDALSSALGALVSGNLTLITVVLSINQLVLSRQLEGIGGLEASVEEVSEYRERVRREVGRDVTPETPAEFLQLLLEDIREETGRLEDAVARADDEDLGDAVDDLVMRLRTHVDRVIRLLKKPTIGIFGVLSATLSTNYAHELNEARRIKVRYDDELPNAAVDALDGIARRVKDVDIARQYFKTMYMQEELSYFSRLLLYVGVPAEFLTVATLIAVSKSGGGLSGLPLTLPLVAPVVVTVAFAPLAVLFSFVMRVSTVAHHTISPAQFTTPEAEGGRRS